MIHIGNLIQQELDRQHRSRAWLAKAIFCSRPNINKIVNRPSINTESLLLISKALHHDFFADITARCDFDEDDATASVDLQA